MAQREFPYRLLALGLCLVYCAGYWLWYAATPLGRVALLDSRELLDLAMQIADGTLAPEPFYRAPLYSALLAGLYKLGISADWLLAAARVLNGVCHVVSTALVFAISLRVWRLPLAAFLSALLFGLYPLAVYFAGDALDTTLALTLFLAGLAGSLSSLADPDDAASQSPPALGAALSAACFALAAFARPHFLPCLAAYLAVLAVLAAHEAARRKALLAAVLASATLLAIYGGANHAVGGQFRITPTQGSYSLWAANGPDANGRYFVQKLRIDSEAANQVNPARTEAESLYRAAKPTTAALDYLLVERYWSERFWQHWRDNPSDWLRLMAAKSFYLINDFEQYNNKTFAFHRERSPWLAYNPLRWGLVLGLSAMALLLAQWNRRVRWLVFILLVYAAGVLLYFVSDRFRFPAVPILAILAGGLFSIDWRQVRRAPRGFALALIAVLGLLVLSFFPLAKADREYTYIADQLLLTNAAQQVGDFALMEREAERALQMEAGNIRAIEYLCLARYNLWLQRLPDSAWPTREIAALARDCHSVAGTSATLRFSAAVLDWRSGNQEHAVATWAELAQGRNSQQSRALAALLATGRAQPAHIAQVQALPRNADPLLALVRSMQGDLALQAELVLAMGAAKYQSEQLRTRAMFAP